MHFYIDGYNFLFRIYKKKQELQRKREAMLLELNELSVSLHLQLTLVFDSAQKEEPTSRRGHFDHLEIIYTAPQETADNHILYLLAHNASAKQSCVVSSDRELLNKAKALRAHIYSVEEFLIFLHKKMQKKKQLAPPRRSGMESPREIARLLKLFEERFEQDNS